MINFFMNGYFINERKYVLLAKNKMQYHSIGDIYFITFEWQ